MLLNKNDYMEYKDFQDNESLYENAINSIYENDGFLDACNNIAYDLIACYEPSIHIDDITLSRYREIATNALICLLLNENFGAFDHQGNFLNDGDLELCSEYVTNRVISLAKQYIN